MHSRPLFAAGTFLWGLAAMCQLHRRPFAPNLVLQQFPPPYSAFTLRDAATALKLKSGLQAIASSALHSVPTPFLAVLGPANAAESSSGPATRPGESAPSRLALVLKCDSRQVLYLTEASPTPITTDLADFAAHYAGELILFGAQVGTAADG